jgi:folate-binding protein YgfZ
MVRSYHAQFRDPTLQDDYRALHEGAAVASLMPRARIGVSGRDRASYLHGLLTNDIQTLARGSGCYAAWLTPQGRMTTDMHVFESGDMIMLDVAASVRDTVQQRLDQFLFSEDVQLSDLTEALTDVSLHGPAAPSMLERVVGLSDLAAWPQYRNVRADFHGSPLVAARIDQLGIPGFTMFVATEMNHQLFSALEACGATRVAAEAVEAVRIEAGYPLFTIDMDEDTIPLEAGIEERAISFTKGCYVGQEVIIRVLHRGHGRVVRKLMGLRVEGEPPARGARLFADSRDIGFVTSAARSPRIGAIALAYIHRDFLAPDTSVDVQVGDGRAPAKVTALPFA